MCEETQLPVFQYFKDPLRIGVFKSVEATCVCCGMNSQYMYVGPVYCREDLHGKLCPTCIKNGKAHEKYGATFVDDHGIGQSNIPVGVVEELTQRTPVFFGWQQEQWWTHCGDAAVFIDYAGKDELLQYGDQCIENVRVGAEMNDEQWQQVFDEMQKGGSVVAYVFQCRHCGEYGGYWDCD